MANIESTTEPLRELALFAGAGGGILGGKLLGWRTVCAVERDAYAASVLAQRQNDGCLEPFPIWSDVCTFDGGPWRGLVDVVSGGFPCQDISVAGKGAGITGARSGLWGEMRRIIGEVRPRYVFVENSPALTFRGLGVVLGELAALGFNAEWGVLGAVHAGAPHKRERIWILGSDAKRELADADVCGHIYGQAEIQPAERGVDARGESIPSGKDVADTTGSQDHAKRGDCECGRHGMGRTEQAAQQDHRAPDHHSPCRCGGDVSHADGAGCEEQHVAGVPVGVGQCAGVPVAEQGCGHGDVSDTNGERGQLSAPRQQPGKQQPRSDGEEGGDRAGGWWATEPDLGRVAHGVADRVDLLRCIGNGQVPIVAASAFRILAGQ